MSLKNGIKIHTAVILVLPVVALADNKIDSQSDANTKTYYELARIYSDTKILEAKIKLSDAYARLKNLEPNTIATMTNPKSGNEERSVGCGLGNAEPKLVAMINGSAGERAIFRGLNGSTLSYGVGDTVDRLGTIQAIRLQVGVQINGVMIPLLSPGADTEDSSYQGAHLQNCQYKK